MIGNDIVDLQAAAVQSNWRRQGYLQKVFTLEEQREIGQARDAARMVWTFWSMKEAAYKAQQREFGLKRRINPSGFECTISRQAGASASGKVSVGDRVYFTETTYKDSCVHTTAAASAATKIFSRIYSSSVRLKERVLEEISAATGLPKSLFSIEKDSNYIPVLRCTDLQTDYPFSLSHHGKYAAFSLPLMKD